jgi:cyclic beta-1,2-glucan synthetase
MNSSSVELIVPSSPEIESAEVVLIDPRSEGPIRAERLGLERLEGYAARLAAACVLAPPRRAGSPLLRRFVENKRVLIQVHRQLVALGDRRSLPGIDAEWLVDNFHIIDDSLREVRHDLPPGYDELLPKLATPPLTGYPRAFALALALVAHCDSELDEARISRFVRAFQEVAPLTIGELWALPTMLRLVLLENLRRLAERMVWGWEERRRAERWARDVLVRAHAHAVAHEPDPAAPGQSLPGFGGLSDPFVVRLMQLLRDQEGAQAAFEHLEAELAAQGSDPNEVLRREHHCQAANQVTVGNCVLSLRLLSAIDWNAFFEQCSHVEAILREDPSGIYPHQEFATSDRYRRMVEMIARGSGADEIEVARRALELARQGRARDAGSSEGLVSVSSSNSGEPLGHVGFYLVDRGQAALKAAFGYRPNWGERLFGWVLGHPGTVYFGGIALGLAALLALAIGSGLGPLAVSWWFPLAVAVLLLPLSELAVGLVNHLLTLLLPPRVLPKLDFKEGIPVEQSTFIVIPSLFARISSAAVLAERLETHYLSNPDPSLRFALLTDFTDAPHETMPQDEDMIRDALERVRGLNDRYRDGESGPDRFFLFHRRRLWNPSEGCWMGWERKRGKLLEFNRLLRGARDTSYAVCSAEPSSLPRIRYVITLDADSQMPRDAAGRLVGALAHPLNRPRFDPTIGRVVAGYGVLQPRVSFLLTAATRSRFAALLATSGGIDPYSTAASDTYMDLFGVGTFTGKGIYDLDAFEEATGDKFPENRILSHDLIEGNYARCGLLSDTELFDDFPARYHAYARREHRWVRGDWQLLPWLVPSGGGSPVGGGSVPRSSGPRGEPSARRPNPLPLLERWKLLDNLRRSLVPPALLTLLVLGWTVLPGSPGFWTATALAVFALPFFQMVLGVAIGCVRGRSLTPLKKAWERVPSTFGQVGLELVFLAYRAVLLLDAIVRTLVRLLVTRRKLLEWETAASTEQRLGTGLAHFVAVMWPAPALAIAIAVAILALRPGAIVVAFPFLVGWLLSPYMAFRVSRPRPVHRLHLTGPERTALRRIARKTWLFFETFVTDADHWLPPDNFQEIPDGRLAHRTSPTNQGLLLLSTLAANDLGYIGPGTLGDRLERTLNTLNGLEKHWGQFYNWYETQTLQPLPPRYISTVDSGNLLGCLITVAHGLREKAEAPVFGPSVIQGLVDTLGLAAEHGSASVVRRLSTTIDAPPVDLAGWDAWLEAFERITLELAGRGLAQSGGPRPAQSTTVPTVALVTASTTVVPATWADRLARQVGAWRAELEATAPWLEALRALDRRGAAPFPSDAARRRWESIREALLAPASLAAIVARADHLAAELAGLESEAAEPAVAEGLRAIAAAVRDPRPAALLDRLHRLADSAEALAEAMDFRPLYRPERHLFAIGFNLVQGRLDNACYDLLASECCLTSYLAVARGEAPRRHWFQLARPFIRAAGRVGLIAWGGTMFEYLMPRLMLRSLPGTLLAEACRTAVARQIEYGRSLGLPWGISESGFSAQYLDGDYQYQAFGVPGLGLKQGLEQDRVIAPYATAMASMLEPGEALANFRHLAQEGAEGEYGFYEAIDYTPERMPKGKRSVVVRSYMAHHQGMSLVALTNALFADVMTLRFQAEPMVRAIDLLLQERVPTDVPIVETSGSAAPSGTGSSSSSAGGDDPAEGAGAGAPMSRRLTTPFTPVPRTHILSNTQYHVMLTNAGSGSSICRGLDVTRWREDAAREAWGQFCYIRDIARGTVWSAGFQPVCRPPESYEVIFAADKATFRRRDAGIETVLEVIVSPEHRAEIRRVTLVNHDPTPRELELTSYAEVVLASRGADLSHPAFAKLFLETEWVPITEAILCRRRMRSATEQPLWAMHVAAVDDSATGVEPVGDTQYETDRARFLGRGRTPANPVAMEAGAVLSGTVGPVLDPVLSLRRRFRLEPGGSVVVALTTAFAESRGEAMAMADQFREPGAVSRAFELAWAHSQVEHRHHDRSGADAHLFQRLASHILFAGGSLRAEPAVLARNHLGQTGLWRFGISGDRPIVLARIDAADQLALVRQLLAAHAYLRLRGLEFDLVLLDEEPGSYLDELNRQILENVRAAGSLERIDQPGGVFVRKSAQMSEDERILLQAAARVVLVGERGPLASQLDRTERYTTLPARLSATREPAAWPDEPVRLPDDLLFFNGLGGFTPDGREYCVLVQGPPPPEAGRNGPVAHHPLAPHPRLPPAPWVNVVANPDFGFVISEGGSGFTWAVNSQANRLTPWSNDPVSDPPGEVVYLRDEETGEIWSPTPLPVPSGQPTLVRHGQGYTVFQRNTHGLVHELTLFVPLEDPVKLIRLRVRNAGDRPRRLSAFYYAEWILGLNRDAAAMHVVTEVDPETGALLARNAFRPDFAGRVAFADVDRRPRTLSADRLSFLGRHGSVANPAALGRLELADREGAALDPCTAIQTAFELRPGAEAEVVFLLGEVDDIDAARQLVRRYREPGRAATTLQEVQSRWDDLLGTVQVRTPDPAVDLLANRWLLYQVLACRYWARSGFYQSGGAYGFRDQLQDVMALVHAAPEYSRAHILRAASHQFLEGDVQHWWHPPTGRGIRTRISDDPLWLTFVASYYVAATGDVSILDQSVPYLQAPPLKSGQEDDYGLAAVADSPGTLYEHCLRALDRVDHQGVGAHGLPLMGTGDWNDGMNRIGSQGRGESVWLAWFEIANLGQFAAIVESRGDSDRAAILRRRAETLRAAVEANAWDGDWYRRAYFDDGTPLGSAQNAACRIDSIAQSWAVLSDAAEPSRARQAMQSADESLVDREGRLILLFTPPFDDEPIDPGYIKGYLPGIRENGGQYTHAATWLVWGFARLGQGLRAFELLEILNPIRHAQDPQGVDRYKVEPYVVAGDVYGRPPHVGRGGWTWYTGSASWLYRTILEAILGLYRRGDRLIIDPRIPPEWPGFEIAYRFRTTTYRIAVQNPQGVESGNATVWVDDQPQHEAVIPLVDDGRTHEVRVVIAPRPSSVTRDL